MSLSVPVVGWSFATWWREVSGVKCLAQGLDASDQDLPADHRKTFVTRPNCVHDNRCLSELRCPVVSNFGHWPLFLIRVVHILSLSRVSPKYITLLLAFRKWVFCMKSCGFTAFLLLVTLIIWHFVGIHVHWPYSWHFFNVFWSFWRVIEILISLMSVCQRTSSR